MRAKPTRVYYKESYALPHRETIDFLSSALRSCRPDDAARIGEQLAEARALTEEEAYRGAAFYDSPTRTLRSAVSAYERFLADYPAGERAEAVRARVGELKAKLEEKRSAADQGKEDGR